MPMNLNPQWNAPPMTAYLLGNLIGRFVLSVRPHLVSDVSNAVCLNWRDAFKLNPSLEQPGHNDTGPT